MAVKEEIEFTIGPDGDIGIQVKGTKGKKCTDLTKDLIEALGMIKNTNYTSEYYQQEEQVTTSVSVSTDGDKKS